MKNKRKRATLRKEMNLHSSDYEAEFAHKLLIERLREYKIKESILLNIEYELSEHLTTIIPFKIVEEQLFSLWKVN